MRRAGCPLAAYPESIVEMLALKYFQPRRIQWQHRILVRWEYYTQNFLGFVQLACLVILLRQF